MTLKRAILPVALILSLGVCGPVPDRADDQAPSVQAAGDNAPASTPDQGISRKRAEEVWAAGTNPALGLVRRWECSEDFCLVQIDPGLWATMEYDFKRDFTAGLGQSAAVLQGATAFTNLVDVMTGQNLATYSASSGSVRIED